jgi:tetratricopeptide (TPR) repeat protein
MYTEVGYAAGRARAMICLGNLMRKRHDWAAAEELIREALALATERGYSRETILGHEALGDYFFERGALAEARSEFETGMATADEIAPDSDLTVELLRRLGEVHFAQGDPAMALRHAERSIAIARRLGDRIEEACSLRLIGLIRADEGDLAQARNYLDEAGAILQQVEALRVGPPVSRGRLAGRAGAKEVSPDRRVGELLETRRRRIRELGLGANHAGALELARSEMQRGLVGKP